MYSFDRKLHFTYFDRSIDEMTERLPGGLSLKTAIDSETTSEIDFAQDGSVYAITPALAVQVTPRLSFGAALNFYRNKLTESNTFTEETTVRWQQATDIRIRLLGLQSGIQPEPMSIFSEGEQTEVKEFSDVEGANLTLGGLWNVTNKGESPELLA